MSWRRVPGGFHPWGSVNPLEPGRRPCPRTLVMSPLINALSSRPAKKNDEMQGAQILGNKAYSRYAAMTKDAASRPRRAGGSRYSTACCSWRTSREEKHGDHTPSAPWAASGMEPVQHFSRNSRNTGPSRPFRLSRSHSDAVSGPKSSRIGIQICLKKTSIRQRRVSQEPLYIRGCFRYVPPRQPLAVMGWPSPSRRGIME